MSAKIRLAKQMSPGRTLHINDGIPIQLIKAYKQIVLQLETANLKLLA
jgi:hypothetical protein